ncbi:S8 family serine peptidase [Thiohalomonas denitrificans]|uniref:S8 family serine peptidase n=1 Tax=Thiohalomonas denitrificans TaxID=415747 RepID=UPI0026EAFAC4|nr:hypothetical protein [Thiohalomonas denitrificans]
MKSLIALSLFISFLTSGCLADTARPSEPPEKASASVVAGELLVRFTDDIGIADVTRIAEELEASVIEQLPRNVYLIRLPEGTPMDDAMRRLTAQPEVVYVEPNIRHRPYSR